MPGRLEIIYYVATSLDGFIATVDGGVNWLTPFQELGEDYGFATIQESVDAVLMGSGTYEKVLEFGGDPLGAMGKPCWVFSKRQLSVLSSAVKLTSASPEDVVGELLARGFTEVWLMGGTGLASSFRAANLISEYSLGLMPVILGTGIPLFESPGPSARLTLIESRSHPSGVVQLRYRVE
jgi:dihydrofolate reductase